MLAAEQRPYGVVEIAASQERLGLSNSEAATLLGVSLSTWATYKNGSAPVPDRGRDRVPLGRARTRLCSRRISGRRGRPRKVVA